jgi:hypothetical protein
MSGGLTGAQIEALTALNPVLLHPAIASKTKDAADATGLNHAVGYVKRIAPKPLTRPCATR